VVVPQFKFRGDNVTLMCKYELKPEEELWSLKWYKEETEFYRFTPVDGDGMARVRDKRSAKVRQLKIL